MAAREMIACKVCQKHFIPKTGHQKFCSFDCRMIALREKQNARIHRLMDEGLCVRCGRATPEHGHLCNACRLKQSENAYKRRHPLGCKLNDCDHVLDNRCCWYCDRRGRCDNPCLNSPDKCGMAIEKVKENTEATRHEQRT